MECAFRQNPTDGSSATAAAQPDGNGAYSLTFTQPSGVSGIICGMEWSTTLAPGSWTPIPDTGVGNTHTFTVPSAGQTRMFTRLVVTAP